MTTLAGAGGIVKTHARVNVCSAYPPLTIALAALTLTGCRIATVPAAPTSTPPVNSAPSATPSTAPAPSPAAFIEPLDRASERTTKKLFGTYVTPQNSPVQPERFTGYHTGLDYEILPGEGNIDVIVLAICNGPLRTKRTVGGYGGVMLQDCARDGSPITVLYGHLALGSVTARPGDQLAAGQSLGNLGAAYSADTSGERKHLHLGVVRGQVTEWRGYVQTRAELSRWLNPAELFN